MLHVKIINKKIQNKRIKIINKIWKINCLERKIIKNIIWSYNNKIKK